MRTRRINTDRRSNPLAAGRDQNPTGRWQPTVSECEHRIGVIERKIKRNRERAEPFGGDYKRRQGTGVFAVSLYTLDAEHEALTVDLKYWQLKLKGAAS